MSVFDIPDAPESGGLGPVAPTAPAGPLYTVAPPHPSGGGGPFINWSSPGSILSSPFRGLAAGGEAAGGLIESAGRGLISLPASAGKELWHDAQGIPQRFGLLTHGDVGGAATQGNAAEDTAIGQGLPEQLAQYSKDHPLTGPFLQSGVATGQDVEQTVRAGLNTIPRAVGGWTPGGASVGALGSGAGLLGTTDLAKAAEKGGGGVAPRLLGDVTNLSLLGGPVESLIGGAADRATAEAASQGEALTAAQAAEKDALKTTSQNVQQAAKQAREAVQAANEARDAAVGGHPVAAADYSVKAQAAQAAMQALRSAQDDAAQVAAEHAPKVSLAQQAADTAQQHADQLTQHAATAKLVAKLGSKAAASPFAPLEYGLPAILEKAAPIAHSIVGSDLGQQYLQPVIDRAHAAAAALGEKADIRHEVGAQREQGQIEKANVDAELQRGFKATVEPLPTVDQPVKRGPFGLFGTKTVPVEDVDAHAVATMAQTGESAHLANLLRDLPKDEALDVFARSNPNPYTPEQLDLAAQVFGPGEATGKAAALREAIPQVREAYAKPGGAEEVQARRYLSLEGEAGLKDVRPAASAGAFAQAEHNVTGTGPRIEGLQQWQKAVTEHGAASDVVRNTIDDPATMQRALDRLDQGLAAKQAEMEASVEAQPRARRPVLQFGENLRATLLPIADQADRDLGPGAGDVYRALASEATITADELFTKYGLDPQFLIGTHEGTGAPFTADVRSGGPVVGKTGQREAGIGLRHATDYETIYRQARARAFKAVDNITGQRIIDGNGGTLADMLDQRGVLNARTMTDAQLAQAMKDAKLSAWDLSDRRGGLLPQSKITADTNVVPTDVWKAWQKYAEKPGGKVEDFLHATYDPTTQLLKRMIRLTPRWQVAITTGHAVMAMVGGGFNPVDYFLHQIPTALRLDKMARTGTISAEDATWIKTLPPQVQAALDEHGGFVPGAVRNRGFVREEFPKAEATRALVGDRGLKLQASLDNMHRTAVWIGQLERGLDTTGLADFRTAYPDLAHLTDTQIQNEAAIRLSIRTMGDYLNKTPAERQIISRIVYFYPWLKHITKLAANTAIHDPLRTAWLLHLGAMFDPGPGPLDFLKTSFDAGQNRWITPPAWDPFEAIVSPADNPLGTVNPIVSTAVAGATGFNLGTGKPVTRPPGEQGPLGLGELANFAANQAPLVRAGREAIPAMVGGTPVVRYQTGQPIISGGRTIPENENQWPGTNTPLPDWLAPLAPYTGVPQQRLIDTGQIVDRQAANSKRDEKARINYEKRRKAANRG